MLRRVGVRVVMFVVGVAWIVVVVVVRALAGEWVTRDFLHRLFRNRRFGDNQLSGDRGRPLQRAADYVRRVDDAACDHISEGPRACVVAETGVATGGDLADYMFAVGAGVIGDLA